MKRWISILLVACLLTGFAALAEEEPAEKLPAPDVVAELTEADDAAEEAEAPEESEAPEAEGIPEEESAEAGEDFELWFEEGFGLTLPAGWVSYAVADQDRDAGVRYILGDGSGARNLYIQFAETSIGDVEALSEAVENTDGLNKTGDLSFGGVDFVAFIDATQNASCCAALLDGRIVTFVFTPQTDSDFMLTASRVMESFNKL